MAAHVSAQIPDLDYPNTTHFKNYIRAFTQTETPVNCGGGAALQPRNIGVGVAYGATYGTGLYQVVFWEYFDIVNGTSTCFRQTVEDVGGIVNNGFISNKASPRMAVVRTAASATSFTLEARIKLGGIWYKVGDHVFNLASNRSMVTFSIGQEAAAFMSLVDFPG